MEKSRAIELLEHLVWDRDIDRNPYGYALNMAIDALKAQLFSEGTTSDLIDRQQAIDGKILIQRTNGVEIYSDEAVSVEYLKSLPPAQPERPKGKWNTYYHSDTEFTYSCNSCGYSAPYQVLGGEVVQKKWNFCPNCGADMRGDTYE